MTDSTAALPEAIECPLCLGKGELSRTEVLERLGMKDFARVAQLSAEEAIRLILKKEKDAEQARLAKFEVELTKRLAAASDKHNAELQRLQTEKSELAARLKGLEKSAAATLDNARQEERLAAEKELQKQLAALTKQIAELEAAQKLAEEQKKAEVAKARTELEAALSSEMAKANDLSRQGKDYLQEIGDLRERNQELEAEMAKVARVGKKEELDFAEEARSWPGIWIGERLPRNGDYLMAFSDAAGNALEPIMVIDNKDKATVAEADVKKLVRDARERKLPVAVLVTREESQLRHVDRQCRWAQEDGVWLLRSTRAWLPRDLEVLRLVFEQMRAEGPDFLQRNAALANEVQRTFVDIDEIEGQLNKAGTAIEKAQALTTKYRTRLAGLCDGAAAGQEMPGKPDGKNGRASAGAGNGTQEHHSPVCSLLRADSPRAD
jgi:DNA repair exonuclease SbcCD ATPase subunit